MRNKKLFQRLMAVVMCSTVLATTPVMTYATTNAVASEEVLDNSNTLPESWFTYQVLADGTYDIIGLSDEAGDYSELKLPVTYNGGQVTGIYTFDFRLNEKIKTVVIPEGYTYIGMVAFEGASNLTTVSLPTTITKFGGGGEFAGCPNLTTVNYAGTKAQWKALMKDGFVSHFGDCPSITVKCSDGNILYNENGEMVEEEESNIIPNSKTGIPDKALYDGILKVADVNKDGVLTVSEAEAITELELVECGISDLTGLNYCKNIKTLTLDGNQIKNISVLSNFKGFGWLNLSNNEISDISALKNVSVDILWLKNNRISDISSLKGHTITILMLDDNQIRDLSAFKEITINHELSLENNGISDLSGLANNTNIKGLYLANNNIRDISPLAGYAREEWMGILDLSNNNIRDISVLKDAKIDELIIDGNPIGEQEIYTVGNDKTGIPDKALYDGILNVADVNKDGVLTVSEAEAITELELVKCGISDLTGLDYCKNVQYLNLSNNNISDVAILKNMQKIISVVLQNNHINDVSVFAEFEGFSTLNLAGNPIKDFTQLKGVYADALSLENCNINDIAFVKDLEAPILSLKNNKITDITVLGEIANIYDWDLSNNNVSDVSPLAKQEFIFSINLSNNSIRDISPLLNVKFICLDVSNNNIRDLGTLADNVEEKFVYDGNPIGEQEIYTIANDKTGIPDKALYDGILNVADANNDGVLTISEAEAITELELIKCGIRDLTGLSYCKNLMALSLGNNNIKDISELSKIENLIILDLSNNQISDISVMADFKSKSDYSLLNLSNNSIGNIDALEGFGADILSLENNKIKDINVFSKIRCFQFDLSHNQISDIGVFASFEKDYWYYSIDLSNNSIRNIEALEGLKINALDLSNNNIRDISILDKVTTDFGIDTNGNPIGEKEVYTEEQFDKLLSENAVSDVVIEVNDKITITFGKGTMKEVDGVTSYDFTATTTNDYATSKLPTSVKADEFVLKISYNYSGNLPAKASVEIFVGKEFAGKTLYYSLLKEDGTLTETQKAVVNADGCMIVTQEHCSDWVITTINPNPTSETPDDGNNNTGNNNSGNTGNSDNTGNNNSNNTGNSDNAGNNNSGDTGSSDNNENNSTNTKPAPNTGDSSLMFMYIALGMISALFITYKKIRKA